MSFNKRENANGTNGNSADRLLFLRANTEFYIKTNTIKMIINILLSMSFYIILICHYFTIPSGPPNLRLCYMFIKIKKKDWVIISSHGGGKYLSHMLKYNFKDQILFKIISVCSIICTEIKLIENVPKTWKFKINSSKEHKFTYSGYFIICQ